jgi:hypothetical protein
MSGNRIDSAHRQQCALTQLNTIKYLQRRLDVAGTLTLANSASSDLYIRDGGTLHLAFDRHADHQRNMPIST